MVQVYENTEVKKRVANAKPYQKWVAEGSQKLQPVEFSAAPVYSTDTLMRLHQYGKLSFIHFCFMRFQAMQILNHLAVVNIDSFEGELSRWADMLLCYKPKWLSGPSETHIMNSWSG